MFRVKVHKNIQRLFELLYRVRFWNREDEETTGEWRLKWFYSIYFCLFPISLIAGAVTSDNNDEKICLVEVTIPAFVSLMRLWYLIWRKKEILEMINRICVYCVDDREAFELVNDKSNNLMKFASIFLSATSMCASFVTFVAPFIGAERKLFFSIGFPLDWRNDEFAFWMAFVFISTQCAIGMITASFSVIVWYLIANSSWRFDVLGQQIRKMGDSRTPVDDSTNERRISTTEKDNLYQRDLVAATASHNNLMEITNQLHSFLSDVFSVQLTTGALGICVSLYSLAFIRGENLVELMIYVMGLMYTFFDIFMIMYFGNEIKLSSDRLSYNLYESDWVDRSQPIKKNVLIFGEFLMKPLELTVLKIYPLTLETFTRVLNSAYSMFNILKNFK